MSISTPAGAVTESPVAPVADPITEILSAPLRNSFDYTRSLGPVLSQFALALRDGRILGSRSADGRVFVPPTEFDPATGAASTELVEVASTGTVTTWSWQAEPTAGQPLSEPFAWGLIKLDGADTALLHAVDTGGDPEALAIGDRVHARWVDDPVGAITDIACFVPGEAPAAAADDPADHPAGSASDDRGPVTMIVTPENLSVQHSASAPESIYLRALAQGTLLGARRGDTGKVYFPPREADPSTGRELDQFVELPDTGTVTTFAIINIPFAGQKITPPYVAAYILLDGADIPFLHLVTGIDAADVRMGLRVKAVWKPREEWGLGIDNIEHFTPSGEPDAEFDSYKHHL